MASVMQIFAYITDDPVPSRSMAELICDRQVV